MTFTGFSPGCLLLPRATTAAVAGAGLMVVSGLAKLRLLVGTGAAAAAVAGLEFVDERFGRLHHRSSLDGTRDTARLETGGRDLSGVLLREEASLSAAGMPIVLLALRRGCGRFSTESEEQEVGGSLELFLTGSTPFRNSLSLFWCSLQK